MLSSSSRPPLLAGAEVARHALRQLETAYYRQNAGLAEAGRTATVDGAGTTSFPGGCPCASTWGTSWHGTLEDDAFRRAFLAEVAEVAGRDFTPAPDTCFAAVRQAQLDVLGDLVAAHLDTAALSQLIREGPPAGLPVIHPAGAVV